MFVESVLRDNTYGAGKEGGLGSGGSWAAVQSRLRPDCMGSLGWDVPVHARREPNPYTPKLLSHSMWAAPGSRHPWAK